jgi:Carboxypeptidase regulatory-like domain
MTRLSLALLLVLVAHGSARAQTQTGTLAGLVTDSSGAALADVHVSVTNRDTGHARAATTSEQGTYSAAALLPGIYHLRVEAAGFKRVERSAVVAAGTTTTVDLSLEVGEITVTVTVPGVQPQIRHDHHQVSGLTTRGQIEALPLNGRSFLELAKLEPGVQQPTRASSNRIFVPALGQPQGNNGRGTRVTVDGGSIMAVGNGGSAMGFSQEVVQEFQVATVNFDLATGITNGASINVATRSGGNELRGSGIYFFRDHTLAAYPALRRDRTNPDPFFQRRQFGFALGGPLRRDRVFFFGDYERNEQRGVVATTLLVPEFAHFSRITPSPYFGNQLSLRVDGRLSNAHTAFIRYSHDGVRAFGPPCCLPMTVQPAPYASAWTRQRAWADQSVLGLTSVLRDTLVNDLRFSYFFVESSQVGPTDQECSGCLGLGAPSIVVAQTGLSLGNAWIQEMLGRRVHVNDVVTWQRGAHRMRFGVDWEHHRGGPLEWNNEPATVTLYSPQRARQESIPLPEELRTLDDILQLPLQSVTVGIGDPRVPQENGSLVRTKNTLRLFFQDTWRVHSRLTVNSGLGWSIDHYFNYDLTRPALLAPILGADGLGPTRKAWKDFSPALGLTWTPRREGKTVARAGVGRFYDFRFGPLPDNERALLGPAGSGRQDIAGSAIRNCLPGIPGVPVGRPLSFVNTPTRFTGADLLACLPAIRAELVQSRANADPSIQLLQLTKQAGSLTLNPVDVPSPSALHVNLGMQREITPGFVVSVDFAYRRFDHDGISQIDLNHFHSARGPVIPRCLTDAERNDPHAPCSTGPIHVQMNAGRTTYKGLLTRVDKRFARGFQLLGSWAYSSNTGINTGIGLNLDDWLGNRGPLDRDVTHIVNVSGIVQLPLRFELGVNFAYASAPAFSAFVGGSDFNGDGTTNDLLPGTTVNAFNRGLERADLENLVAQFNRTRPDTLDGKGAQIPRLILPSHYWLGDAFQSLDVRLSHVFRFQDRYRLALMGEVFNLYNAANLSGYSGNLTDAALFGQPTSRATQVFGSGGPRAVQLAARVSF